MALYINGYAWGYFTPGKKVELWWPPQVVTSRVPACGSTSPGWEVSSRKLFRMPFYRHVFFFFRPRKLAEKDVSGFGIRFFVSEAQLQRWRSGQIIATSHDRFGPEKIAFLEWKCRNAPAISGKSRFVTYYNLRTFGQMKYRKLVITFQLTWWSKFVDCGLVSFLIRINDKVGGFSKMRWDPPSSPKKWSPGIGAWKGGTRSYPES